MNWGNKIKMFLVGLADVFLLYLSLLLALLLRYRGAFYVQFVNYHLVPFSVIFVVWMVVFYVSGLYELRRLRNNLDFLRTLYLAIIINAVIAVFFFYLIPSFGITPKTNLFLFLVVFAVIEVLWRRTLNRSLAQGESPNRVLIVDGNGSDSLSEIEPTWFNGLGYEVVARAGKKEITSDDGRLKDLAHSQRVSLIVISRKIKNNPKLTRVLYELLNEGLEIRDLPNFYELVARKIPLAELEEAWFIENLAERERFYDPLKRAWEFLAALFIAVILLPLEIVIAVIIKLSSRGPAIYRQKRVGRSGRSFTLFKFRTMREDAERDGARWAEPGDKRVTLFGKFLRYTHLDELPQLWNIIKGDLAFVGPRPERPEFVKTLQEKIPYYEIRHLIKPGVTGWAQIHHRADVSEGDVMEKLQYDIYYIKNRSPILDLAIILKTLKTLFVTPK